VIEIRKDFIGNGECTRLEATKKAAPFGATLSKRQSGRSQEETKVGAAPETGVGHKRVENRESRFSGGLFIDK
jgi:hypothetical protein